jgi:hypothetical protein
MRTLLGLMTVVCGLTGQVLAFQAGSPAPIRACTLLTKDLVAPFTANKRVLDIMAPEEEPMKPSGSACEWGVVRLQIMPVPATAKRAAPSPQWQPLTGAGETAFFRANGNEYAELMVWAKSHYLTLQVGVPSGSTPQAIRPNTVTLANAIIAKIK